MMNILFWLSLFLIFYVYVGYTLLLLVIAMFRKRETRGIDFSAFQKVSLIISAYNEEKVIKNKIQNSLSLNYPGELLEIIIISDGSTDRTEEIVSQYSDRGVILKSYPGRLGKTACLNKAVQLAKGDIVVFSDANSQYDAGAVKELVRHFSDEEIGFVTGHTRYVAATDEEKVLPIGIYSQIEKLIKKLESKVSSCVGADGAIFAIRKKLYQPLSDYDINDYVIPMQIIRQGYRGVIEEKAFCVEKAAEGSRGEYDRQVRITNRTIRAIFKNADMLNPLKYGFIAFELFSHKLLKYLSPFFVITLFVSNAFLINNGAFYIVTFIGQICFYALAALGYTGKCKKGIPVLISFSETFTITNLAMLMGWMRYVEGDTFTTWTKVR